ncbi:MAG: cytochrome P450 [Polyangiales bacterium]
MSSSSQATTVPDDPWFGVDPHDREETRDDPYPALNRVRELHPVHRTPLGYYRVFRFADVMRLLREAKVGVRTTTGVYPGVDESQMPRLFMLQQDPPNHTRLRRLVSRAFTPPAIERLRPRVQAHVDVLIDRALEAGQLDIIEDLAQPVPSTMICEMLGVPLADRALFIDWTAHVTHLLQPRFMSAAQRERAVSAIGQLWSYFTNLIAERKQQLGDDMLSALIRAEEAGDQLSPQELVVQAIGLLIAGFETTIGLIGNGVRALLMHPEELAKLRAQPALIGRAVEECLRFDGPIAGTLRVVHEDVEIGGVVIPKDTQVMASIFAAHRDPRVFHEPDRFSIERDYTAHLAFGGGIHFCLGAHLARMEAQIAIGSLVRRVPKLELVDAPLTWSPSMFRVLARLPVRAGA